MNYTFLFPLLVVTVIWCMLTAKDWPSLNQNWSATRRRFGIVPLRYSDRLCHEHQLRGSLARKINDLVYADGIILLKNCVEVANCQHAALSHAAAEKKTE